MGKKVQIKSEKDIPPLAVSLGEMTWNKTGSWRNFRPIIDYEKCTCCMLCWKFCPDVSIHIQDGIPVINYDYCKGCLICVEECAQGAIKTESEG